MVQRKTRLNSDACDCLSGKPKYDLFINAGKGKGAVLTGQNKNSALATFIILQLFIGHQGESNFNPLPRTARLRRHR